MNALKDRFDFFCYGCGASFPLGENFTCGQCGDPLSIRALALPEPGLFRAPPKSLWDYSELLPIASQQSIVSLGEGATPLVEAPRLAAQMGFGALSLKNEMANPSGSFKDRQVSVGLSHAREIGADTVAVVSSGNVAAATAAYAARAGLRAVLLMHGHASAAKIAQAAVYGGNVVCVDSPSPKTVFDLCMAACERWGWQHLSTAGIYEPFNVEGAKTIAYELCQQYGADLPDWIVAPVGGGGLLGGIWRGFLDLERLGAIDKIPRLAGVQASGCAPLTKALDEGLSFQESLNDPWPDPKTVAGGIADDILFDGHTVLPAIRETDGVGIAVDDEAIVEGLHFLARTEGLACELTSAVVIAALRHLPDTTDTTRVCCILTGNGIKDLGYLAEQGTKPPRIDASLEALEKVVAVAPGSSLGNA